jgi:hypothetical protein
MMIPALALQPSPPTVEGAATILGRACVSVPAAPLVAIHPWSKGNDQPVDGDSVVDVVGNCAGRQSQAFDFLSELLVRDSGSNEGRRVKVRTRTIHSIHTLGPI